MKSRLKIEQGNINISDSLFLYSCFLSSPGILRVYLRLWRLGWVPFPGVPALALGSQARHSFLQGAFIFSTRQHAVTFFFMQVWEIFFSLDYLNVPFCKLGKRVWI